MLACKFSRCKQCFVAHTIAIATPEMIDDRAVGPYCKAPGCIIFAAHSKSRMAVLVSRRETVRKRMVRTRRVRYMLSMMNSRNRRPPVPKDRCPVKLPEIESDRPGPKRNLSANKIGHGEAFRQIGSVSVPSMDAEMR